MRGTSLRVGQKLAIHAKEPTQTKVEASKKPVVSQSGNNVYYTIRAGDTLWDIASARGLSLEDLKRWNSDVNFNRMKPGQKIIVDKK